jgi:hypothetical protein
MDLMSPTECLLQMCDEHFSLEDYQSGVPRWCTGCGDNAILAAVQRLPWNPGRRTPPAGSSRDAATGVRSGRGVRGGSGNRPRGE